MAHYTWNRKGSQCTRTETFCLQDSRRLLKLKASAKKVARRSRFVKRSKTKAPNEVPRPRLFSRRTPTRCSSGESVGHETVRKAATLSAQRELYMEEKGSPGKLRSNLSSHWKTLVRIGAAPSGSERSGGMIRRLHKRQLSTRL